MGIQTSRGRGCGPRHGQPWPAVNLSCGYYIRHRAPVFEESKDPPKPSALYPSWSAQEPPKTAQELPKSYPRGVQEAAQMCRGARSRPRAVQTSARPLCRTILRPCWMIFDRCLKDVGRLLSRRATCIAGGRIPPRLAARAVAGTRVAALEIKSK